VNFHVFLLLLGQFIRLSDQVSIYVLNFGCWRSFLDEVGTSCEAATEFLALYKKLFAKDHWKYYLAVKGVPVRIAGLITKVRSG